MTLKTGRPKFASCRMIVHFTLSAWRSFWYLGNPFLQAETCSHMTLLTLAFDKSSTVCSSMLYKYGACPKSKVWMHMSVGRFSISWQKAVYSDMTKYVAELLQMNGMWSTNSNIKSKLPISENGHPSRIPRI